LFSSLLDICMFLIIIIIICMGEWGSPAGMEGRIGKARLLLRRRGHRLETEEEEEKNPLAPGSQISPGVSNVH
jgi:hypothetical protein